MQLADAIATANSTSGAGRPGDPCVMVIFGASGDLTKRKLIPALYNLAKDNLLSKDFALVGVARNEMTTDEFRDMINKEIGDFATPKLDPQQWDWLSKGIYYISGDFGDPVVYQNLSNLLTTLDKEHNTRGNYFFYLATSPSFFSPVIKQLGAAGLVSEEHGWRRVIIEKPFGRDYESAKKLNIQITVSETVGVEQRGMYYDTAGTLRDMVPNHIFQLISLTAMEPPVSFDADVVRDEQAKILRALTPMNDEEVLTRT